MRRDRLKVVLQVRELAEKRRLAERVAAQRQLRDAEIERDIAEEARAKAARPPSQAAHVQLLVLHRLGGLAHTEAVESAQQRVATAHLQAERASRMQVEAAVARRSVERLQERRFEEQQRADQKVADRRNDDVGLETWRRQP